MVTGRGALSIAIAGSIWLAAGCSGSTDTAGAGSTRDGDPGPRRIIVDYSPTVSDVTALLYLTQQPEVELLAVTLSGTGESHCDTGVANTIGLLELAGLPDVPVACGRTDPIGPGNSWPAEWREASDTLAGLDLPTARQPDSVDAADLMAEIAAQQTGPVTVIALGPLTNLAAAVREHPDLADDVAMIFTMGGAFEISGNSPNRSAEWNYFVDPTAVDVVFRSGIPVTVVPLDATDDVPVTRAWFAGLGQHRTTAAARAVHDLLTATPSYELGFYFWDELTAATAIDPTLASYEDLTVSVVADGERAGRTRVSDSGASVRVAMMADAERFERELLTGLNAGAPPPDLAAATDQEAAYFTAVNESAEQLDQDIGRLFESPAASAIEEFVDDEFTAMTPDQEQLVRDFASMFWSGAVDLIGAHAAELATFDVPDSARQPHDDYLAAIQGLVDDEARRLGVLAKLDGDQLVQFLWGDDIHIERVSAACAEVETEALLRGLEAEWCST